MPLCTLALGEGRASPYKARDLPGSEISVWQVFRRSEVLCHVPSGHAKVNWKLGQVSTTWQQNLNWLPEVLHCGVQGIGIHLFK